MTKVAINGFGRIGRLVLRQIFDKKLGVEAVAINDLADTKTLAHLFKYDSTYGVYAKDVESGEGYISVDNDKIKVFAEKDPAKLPWKDLGVDIVLECTGCFTEYNDTKLHLDAGAKKVIISAPSKSKEIPVYVLGVNADKYNSETDNIVSMGSCTTNCLAPVAKVINDNFGIVSGFMTTVHAYTNDQRILDLVHKDLRRSRTAGQNIIPTSTGAALAIGKVLPEIEGKLNGIALRVPVSTVSILDLQCEVETKATAEEVNAAFEKAAKVDLKKYLSVENSPLVSSDFKASEFSAIIDSQLTMANGNIIKVFAWYDNEWAYALRLAEFAEFMGKQM